MRAPLPARHRRQEAVLLGVDRQVLDQLAPEGLERAARVVDARRRSRSAIRRLASQRGQAPQHEAVLPVACASRRRCRSPARASRSERGMSAGSFCRSPSSVTTTSPRAWSKPAASAAVWPKLRRKRITRTRGSRAPQLAACARRLPSRRAVVDEEDLASAARGRSSARARSPRAGAAGSAPR